MLEMRRNLRQKVIAGAAVAVLLGGASVAAVSATGEGNGHGRAHARHAPRRLHQRDLEAAAAYLGVSSEQLAHELSSRSLVQIAEARGKPGQGLVEAIVADRRARLAKLSAALPKRVRAEVSRAVGPAPPGRGLRALALFTATGHLGSAAADYLGLTPAQLRDQLQAGSSLAQIAAKTAGKSKAGLIGALIAAKQRRIAAVLAAGKLTHARAARREQRLHVRMNALTERKFAGSHTP